jgi:hypothetical protein
MHIVGRCFFVPWPRADAADFVAKAVAATNKGASGAAHRPRHFSVVCWDDPGTPLRYLGFGLTTRIEIIGHGQAGSPYISNSGRARRKQRLPFSLVCDRMIAKGLQKRYVGAISCGTCYSGVGSNTNPSFADLVSRYLNHKGFLALHTIGYMGKMSSAHEAIPGHKHEHRPVHITKSDGSETTIKTSDWSAWKYYTGIRSVPERLQDLPIVIEVGRTTPPPTFLVP